MRVRRNAVWVIAAAGATVLSLALTPASARAQDLPLAQLLPDLILREIVLQSFEYNEPTILISGATPGPGCGGFPGFTCKSVSLDELTPRPGNLTLLLGTGGVKFNPVGNLLISASVLFPLSHAGLRSRVTTVIGIDYAF